MWKARATLVCCCLLHRFTSRKSSIKIQTITPVRGCTRCFIKLFEAHLYRLIRNDCKVCDLTFLKYDYVGRISNEQCPTKIFCVTPYNSNRFSLVISFARSEWTNHPVNDSYTRISLYYFIIFNHWKTTVYTCKGNEFLSMLMATFHQRCMSRIVSLLLTSAGQREKYPLDFYVPVIYVY